jgi:uncharacterized protein
MGFPPYPGKGKKTAPDQPTPGTGADPEPYTPAWEQQLPVVPQIQVTRNCNLACNYCYEERAGGIIDLDTVALILRRVIAHNARVDPGNRRLQVYWHGGEPLLAGLDFFDAVLRLQAQYSDLVFENRLQTNGTLVNDAVGRWLAAHRFQVGFSLDGPQDIHDRHRRFRGSGLGSFDAVMQGIATYRRYATAERVPVIAVVTRTGITRAPDIFHFFRELRADVQLDIFDLRWMDLLGMAGSPELIPAAAEVGRFLMELFDLWFYDRERRVDFSELRQEVKLILQPEIDRGDPFHKKRCDFRRLIFAPSGQVFSCDQWVNDADTALGDIHRDPLYAILKHKAGLWAEIKRHLRQSGDQMACGRCAWGRQCGGGCFTCMKYNAMLMLSRAAGLPASRWFEAVLPPGWRAVQGETYYCTGLQAFRQHVRQAVSAELDGGKPLQRSS